MKWYHGTTLHSAKIIVKGGVDTNIGGGELGRGFYVGSRAYVAFARAWHTAYKKDNTPQVVEFTIPKIQTLTLNYTEWNRKKALYKWRIMMKKGENRTKIFGYDIIKAPLLGGGYWGCMQLKFEGKIGQAIINNKILINRRLL